MERIALISDIHANIHALQVFMDYVNRECPVSSILNMGDFIQIGPNPAEVYDMVMNDPRFINIMGNSEAMFFDEELRQLYESEAAHQVWTAEQLGPERMETLRQLPLQRIVKAGENSFLMVHARIDRTADTPILYNGGDLGSFLSDYGTDSDCVLIGHTHLPLYAVHWHNRPVINPGSIGCGKDGVVRFAIAEINDGLMNISYKQLKYNKGHVLCDYEKYAVPCREKFIAMFY